MFRDILANRAILAGLAFFVLIVSGSLFYSWHVRRATEAEFAQTETFPQSVENKKDVGVSQDFESIDTHTIESSEAPIASDDPQAMSEEKEALPLYNTDAVEMTNPSLPRDGGSTEEERTDVPVSPYGFGPYPEIPQGFPEHLMPIWTWSDEKRQRVVGREIDFELMHRVLIKLYNDGDHEFRAVIRNDENGKIYPLYDNVVYVKRWQEMRLPGGTVAQYPAGQLTTEGFISPRDFVESGGKLPAHIKFIDRDTAGYDPYNFLNLERKE